MRQKCGNVGVRCHTGAVPSNHDQQSPSTPPSETLTIVGSRLQALSLASIAVALLVAKRSDLLPWILPFALLCLAWAITIISRHAILSPAGVRIRRIHGTKEALKGDFEAYADHRYLLLRFSDGSRARIEVPVEIRPNVRTWAERSNLTD